MGEETSTGGLSLPSRRLTDTFVRRRDLKFAPVTRLQFGGVFDAFR